MNIERKEGGEKYDGNFRSHSCRREKGKREGGGGEGGKTIAR